MREIMTTSIEQEFNKIWNKADYDKKRRILRELTRLINRKEKEKQQIKAYFEAVKNENIKAVRSILKNGCNVNQKDENLGNTALAYAVFTGNTDLIKLLLEYGADPYIENERGYNSIDAAKTIGNERVISLLADH